MKNYQVLSLIIVFVAFVPLASIQAAEPIQDNNPNSISSWPHYSIAKCPSSNEYADITVKAMKDNGLTERDTIMVAKAKGSEVIMDDVTMKNQQGDVQILKSDRSLLSLIVFEKGKSAKGNAATVALGSWDPLL